MERLLRSQKPLRHQVFRITPGLRQLSFQMDQDWTYPIFLRRLCFQSWTVLDGARRGSIGMVKPSGWHTVRDDSLDGKYLYNRCHLIAWCLSGMNAEERNLITGTRYMNVEGMLPYETQVASYIERTGNSVLYKVTPDFRDNELLARGVRIQAQSVDGQDDELSFDVYCYNVQPGYALDYLTGAASKG